MIGLRLHSALWMPGAEAELLAMNWSWQWGQGLVEVKCTLKDLLKLPGYLLPPLTCPYLPVEKHHHPPHIHPSATSFYLWDGALSVIHCSSTMTFSKGFPGFQPEAEPQIDVPSSSASSFTKSFSFWEKGQGLGLTQHISFLPLLQFFHTGASVSLFPFIHLSGARTWLSLWHISYSWLYFFWLILFCALLPP